MFGAILYDFHMSLFIEHFLTFWNIKMFQAYFIIFLPQPWNIPLLQRLVLHFSGGYLQAKICMLCVLIAAGESLQLRCHCL